MTKTPIHLLIFALMAVGLYGCRTVAAVVELLPEPSDTPPSREATYVEERDATVLDYVGKVIFTAYPIILESNTEPIENLDTYDLSHDLYINAVAQYPLEIGSAAEHEWELTTPALNGGKAIKILDTGISGLIAPYNLSADDRVAVSDRQTYLGSVYSPGALNWTNILLALPPGIHEIQLVLTEKEYFEGKADVRTIAAGIISVEITPELQAQYAQKSQPILPGNSSGFGTQESRELSAYIRKQVYVAFKKEWNVEVIAAIRMPETIVKTNAMNKPLRRKQKVLVFTDNATNDNFLCMANPFWLEQQATGPGQFERFGTLYQVNYGQGEYVDLYVPCALFAP